jgi:ATP-binding cassette subfamily F protein uup
MALIGLQDVHKTLGDQHLLRGVSLVIEPLDRVGLLGPNGAGKSTLLKILAGSEEADEGQRTLRRDTSIGYLEQEPWLDPDRTIRDEVRAGLGRRAAVLARLDEVHAALAEDTEPQQMDRLLAEQARLDDELERLGGHDVEHRIGEVLTHLGLPEPEARCGRLSGGEKRRVALARVLLAQPDLLLLDEPTNHLDAVATQWLERFLASARTTLVMVTHDRYFLDRVVGRILEIDRGELHAYEGGYHDFLVQRAHRLEIEQKTESTRLNLLRRETAWMRRGPPARTTKAKARIDRYHQLEADAPEAERTELDFAIP